MYCGSDKQSCKKRKNICLQECNEKFETGKRHSHRQRQNCSANADCAERAGLEVVSFSYQQGAPFWATSLLYALHRGRLITLSKDVPVFQHWLFPLAILLGAAIDIPRSLFFKTSQMVFVLRRRGG